jgi:hypothetical protein
MALRDRLVPSNFRAAPEADAARGSVALSP